MAITLNGQPLLCHGDTATFRHAPDITVTILSTTIYSDSSVGYTVCWIADGKRNEEHVKMCELL